MGLLKEQTLLASAATILKRALRKKQRGNEARIASLPRPHSQHSAFEQTTVYLAQELGAN